jgi:hypothetical protein
MLNTSELTPHCVLVKEFFTPDLPQKSLVAGADSRKVWILNFNKYELSDGCRHST